MAGCWRPAPAPDCRIERSQAVMDIQTAYNFREIYLWLDVSALRRLQLAELVDRKPHAAPVHVHLCVAQRPGGARLQLVHCAAEGTKFETNCYSVFVRSLGIAESRRTIGWSISWARRPGMAVPTAAVLMRCNRGDIRLAGRCCSSMRRQGLAESWFCLISTHPGRCGL